MPSISTRARRNSIISSVLTIIALAVLIPTFIAGVIFTLNAAAASGLHFFQYAMLNKFGTFMLLWNYNPGAYMLIIVLSFVSAATLFVTRNIRN